MAAGRMRRRRERILDQESVELDFVLPRRHGRSYEMTCRDLQVSRAGEESHFPGPGV